MSSPPFGVLLPGEDSACAFKIVGSISTGQERLLFTQVASHVSVLYVPVLGLLCCKIFIVVVVVPGPFSLDLLFGIVSPCGKRSR